jgi:hypothetical protein
MHGARQVEKEQRIGALPVGQLISLCCGGEIALLRVLLSFFQESATLGILAADRVGQGLRLGGGGPYKREQHK